MVVKNTTLANIPKLEVLIVEILVCNISGEVRQEKFMGEDYFVIPSSMLVEGVLNGSLGPLYYPSSTITTEPGAWNGIPIVLNHPQDSKGNYISARYPDILEKYGVGNVFNSKADNDKLQSESWINKRRLKEVSPELVSKLLSNEKVELSTGLFTAKVDKTEGVFNTKKYTGVVSAYTPDHLAILPNEKGACSINDGCGLNNQEGGPVNQSVLDKIKSLLGMTAKKEKSVGEIQSDLRKLIEVDHKYYWIAEMYADYFIYSNDTTYYKQGFTVSDSGEVSLVGSATEVERKVVYNKEGGDGRSPDTSNPKESGETVMPLSKEQREELVGNIIGNCACEKTKEPLFKDEDKEVLNKFSDEQLQHLANKTKVEKGTKTVEKPEEVTTPVTNKEGDTPKQITDEEWLKTAPPAVREAVANTLRRDKEYKEALIKTITANEKCRMTNELLMSKPVEELENLAEMLGPANDETEGGSRYFGTGTAPYGIKPKDPKALNQETRLPSTLANWASSNPVLTKN